MLSGYLLFAANFEDFHTIAKKLGAENFSKSFIKNPVDKSDAASYEGTDYERSFEIQQKSHHTNHKKYSNSRPKDTKIDFDKLVERVKKRIEKELKEKYYIERDTEIITINKNHKENDKNKDTTHKQEVKKNVKETSPVEYDTEYVEEITDRPKKPFNKNEGLKGKIKKTTKALVEDKRLEYADASIEMTIEQKRQKQKSTYNDEFSFETVTYTYTDDNDKNQKIRTTKYNFVSREVNNLPFKKIHMSKKDSYEDYNIPEKETNIYSSSEIKPQKPGANEKRYNIKKQNREKTVTKDMELTTHNLKKRSKRIQLKKSTPNDEYIDKFVESAEIKAKTVHAYDFDEMTSKENTKRVKSVTNKPTRERYKAVTPNYYAKLPTVVEKYDFNEPLPEKDRERENLKYYGNPPALINKKVRLL